jgi:TatD DNase family protein
VIDIGANLAHDGFDADRDAVLQRAWDAGLEAIVITGSSAESSRRAIEIAHQHRGRVFATAGLHPHHAAEWDAAHAMLFRELATDPSLVSLGECGLDYFRDLSPRDAQRKAFEAQLVLAAELRKPLFLHQRDAHGDFLAMLREHRDRLGAVCVHCFTDTRAAAEDYLSLDCHIGITGWICDERRGRHLLEIVPLIPRDRLLLETDAPYLLPRTIPKALLPPRRPPQRTRVPALCRRDGGPCLRTRSGGGRARHGVERAALLRDPPVARVQPGVALARREKPRVSPGLRRATGYGLQLDFTGGAGSFTTPLRRSASEMRPIAVSTRLPKYSMPSCSRTLVTGPNAPGPS